MTVYDELFVTRLLENVEYVLYLVMNLMLGVNS